MKNEELTKALKNVIKDDAEDWGNALNDAAWQFIESYQKITPCPPFLFNNCKSMIRDAVLKYIEKVEL